MKKLLAFFIMAITSGILLHAQNLPYPLSTWNFNQQNNEASFTEPEITASLVQLFGVTPINYENVCDQYGYHAKGWTTGSTADFSQFYEFTITPPINQSFELAEVSFGYYRSTHGPLKGELRSSLDNFTSSFNFDLSIGNSCALISIGLGSNLDFLDVSGPVTFRIYPFEAGINQNAKVLVLDDISVNGIVTPGTTLPVKFMSFTASHDNNSVELNWSTAFEKNNDYFAIERSMSGNTFEEIGTVAGAMNSSSVKTYKFIDQNLIGKSALYRIRQVDLDGKFAYSNIIPVEILQDIAEANSVVIFSSNKVSLIHASQTEALIKVDIMDMNGRIIENYTLPVNKGQNYYDLSTGQLPSGAYLLLITTDQEIISRKFIR